MKIINKQTIASIYKQDLNIETYKTINELTGDNIYDTNWLQYWIGKSELLNKRIAASELKELKGLLEKENCEYFRIIN